MDELFLYTSRQRAIWHFVQPDRVRPDVIKITPGNEETRVAVPRVILFLGLLFVLCTRASELQLVSPTLDATQICGSPPELKDIHVSAGCVSNLLFFCESDFPKEFPLSDRTIGRLCYGNAASPCGVLGADIFY